MTIDGAEHAAIGDAELLLAVRGGDQTSFSELYDRHAAAALVVARQYTDSVQDAEDVVADAFTAVWSALLRGNGPQEAFRAYLFTVVRRVAAVRRDQGRRTEPTDDVATLEAGSVPMAGADDPAIEGFERSVVNRAFRTLPERWQVVLWHSEVEGLSPAQIAPLLGLSANSTAALAYRAREGLRQAYLAEHLAAPLDEGCRNVAGRLGGYVRAGLGPRETRQVAEHLDGCVRCTALVAELGDVNHGMRAVVAPVVLGSLAAAVLAKGLAVGGGLVALPWAAGAGAGALGGATGSGAAGGS
uniref:sigma-70 family RNA polymerase sigma factor n=1 Tax=Cellulomonas citrea TaxID=1909423 RepID=UPI0013591B1A